jgi:hypothetical protein
LSSTEDRVIRLAEEDARRILMRASELDAQKSGSMTAEELRDIASEAGISTESFLQALRDMRAPVPTTQFSSAPGKRPFWKRFIAERSPSASDTRPSVLRSLVAIVAGGVLGITGIMTHGFDSGAFAGFLAMIFGSVHLVSYHRHKGSNETFQLELLALWMSYVAWFAMVTQDDEAILLGFVWLALAVLGGIVVALSGRPATREED